MIITDDGIVVFIGLVAIAIIFALMYAGLVILDALYWRSCGKGWVESIKLAMDELR